MRTPNQLRYLEGQRRSRKAKELAAKDNPVAGDYSNSSQSVKGRNDEYGLGWLSQEFIPTKVLYHTNKDMR